MTERSDGSKANYYDLPKGAKVLGDLIAYRNLNHADGEMFCAIYRKGRASHSDALRDAKKVLYYAQSEVRRLEAMQSGGRHAMTPGYIEYPDESAWMVKKEPCRSGGFTGEGWIPWGGGECPVDKSAKVRMKWRNGTRSESYYYAEEQDWEHKGELSDIIAYRVLD